MIYTCLVCVHVKAMSRPVDDIHMSSVCVCVCILVLVCVCVCVHMCVSVHVHLCVCVCYLPTHVHAHTLPVCLGKLLARLSPYFHVHIMRQYKYLLK